ENGFSDVADGVVGCLWTGARIIDMCGASLADLKNDTWRYIPTKTQKTEIEALPGIMPVLRARIDRRQSQPVATLNRDFLVSPTTGRTHTTASFWRRYMMAKSRAIASDAVPETFILKRVQDTRDTCITRLADAGVEFMRIWPWTGHSPKGCEDILRVHYISLRDEGAIETVRKLEAWAERNKVSLSAGT
ncbi:MAG: hypothetical protein ACYDD1_18565, partial [Caulobacteraceae bacterium]